MKLRLRRNRKLEIYIIGVFLLLLILSRVFRYETIYEISTPKYKCEVLIDRWYTKCFFCYEKTISIWLEGLLPHYIVRVNDKKVLSFYLSGSDGGARILKPTYDWFYNAPNIKNDTLTIIAMEFGTSHFIQIPLENAKELNVNELKQYEINKQNKLKKKVEDRLTIKVSNY